MQPVASRKQYQQQQLQHESTGTPRTRYTYMPRVECIVVERVETACDRGVDPSNMHWRCRVDEKSFLRLVLCCNQVSSASDEIQADRGRPLWVQDTI